MFRIRKRFDVWQTRLESQSKNRETIPGKKNTSVIILFMKHCLKRPVSSILDWKMQRELKRETILNSAESLNHFTVSMDWDTRLNKVRRCMTGLQKKGLLTR